MAAPVTDEEQAGSAQQPRQDPQQQAQAVPEPRVTSAADTGAATAASTVQPAALVRPRIGSTLRGKRVVVMDWPAESVALIKQAVVEHRHTYRVEMERRDEGGRTWSLTEAALVSRALERALEHTGDWAATIPDIVRDGEGQERARVGHRWPDALRHQLEDALWDLQVTVQWPQGFKPTKASVALAGVLYELPRVRSWLLTIPNDDRFAEPSPFDRRRRNPQPR